MAPAALPIREVISASMEPSAEMIEPSRLQNVNGGHSGTLAFYFCPFWGACRQVTRACRQDYFFVVDI